MGHPSIGVEGGPLTLPKHWASRFDAEPFTVARINPHAPKSGQAGGGPLSLAIHRLKLRAELANPCRKTILKGVHGRLASLRL